MINAHMDVARRYAQLSTAKRLQVGAIIVKEDRIISIGYNGTVSGWDNSCEYVNGVDEKYNPILVTHREVIHAEMNCIGKLASSSESGKDSVMFLTHAPCIECAKLIYNAGIKKVYYGQNYRDPVGLEFLQKCNVEIELIGSDVV